MDHIHLMRTIQSSKERTLTVCYLLGPGNRYASQDSYKRTNCVCFSSGVARIVSLEKQGEAGKGGLAGVKPDRVFWLVLMEVRLIVPIPPLLLSPTPLPPLPTPAWEDVFGCCLG